MRIQAVQNYQHNNFTGATVPHYQINHGKSNDKEPTPHKPMPEWARKGALATLLFFAFKNDPAVINFMTPEETKREEKFKTEFLEDVYELRNKYDNSAAMYHLNRLIDVDNLNINTKNMAYYQISIPLDKKRIDTQISLFPMGHNILTGKIKDQNGQSVQYRAVFSDDNPDEFKIQMRNKNNDTYTFGRTPKGEFYQIDGSKKIILNKKNVQKYQKSIENLPNFEDIQDLEFFTTKNDMWRKLNLLLLAFLLFNEMAHDNARRKSKKD